MQITYTNIVVIGGKPTLFTELTQDEKANISNRLLKTSLETLGAVRERKSA